MPSGVQTSFCDVYQQYAHIVRAVARHLLRDRAEAEDLVQDVFVQALRQLDRFDPQRGELGAWLCSIARSRAFDRLRYRQVRLRADPASVKGPSTEALDPCDAAALARDSERIRGKWAALPPATRVILHLAYYENMSQRQIASAVGETLGVVKSRLRQGLLALREDLDAPSAGAVSSISAEEVALTTERLTAEEPQLPSLAGISVMTVDDDRHTRDVMLALLDHVGATTTMCQSGEEVLATLDHVRPHVLLADLNMPGTDGMCLIRKVRAMSSSLCNIPAIAFTGRGAEADRAGALIAGFQMHMHKPVHPLAVVAAVRQLAGGAPPLRA